MAQDPQAWGGDVRMPGWLRRLLRRPPTARNTDEAAHEARKRQQAGDDAAVEHMRAAGTLAPHHSESSPGTWCESSRSLSSVSGDAQAAMSSTSLSSLIEISFSPTTERRVAIDLWLM